MPTVSDARQRQNVPAKAFQFETTGMVCQIVRAGLCRRRKATMPQASAPVHFAICNVDFATPLDSRDFEAIAARQENA